MSDMHNILDIPSPPFALQLIRDSSWVPYTTNSLKINCDVDLAVCRLPLPVLLEII
ncbi:hypothetical protein LguiA_033995 [Lonicera macranthoides]